MKSKSFLAVLLSIVLLFSLLPHAFPMRGRCPSAHTGADEVPTAVSLLHLLGRELLPTHRLHRPS